MTTRITKADLVAWKQAFSEFQAAKESLEILEPPCEDHIMRAALDQYCDAEETLLTMPAPDLGAVIDKLEIMWEEEIEYNLIDSARKRVIIDDLCRIGVLNSLF